MYLLCEAAATLHCFRFLGARHHYFSFLALNRNMATIDDGVSIVRKEEIEEFMYSYLLYLDTAEKH